MPRRGIGVSVFDAAIDRLLPFYESGDRVVTSFSGGKDSTCVLELNIIAAKMTGRLPIDIIMRDEEIAYPGTYEYCMRVAERPEVNFTWIYACQPIVNVFDREMPYYWAFDPQLSPDQWMSVPPDFAYQIPEKNIDSMTIPSRFPPDAGTQLVSAIGVRAQESRGRLMGVFSMKGHVTGGDKHGVPHVWPIYDWKDTDVWRAIQQNKWDYNTAYDVFSRLGLERRRLRIAPPAINAVAAKQLHVAVRAWPRWFDKLCRRLPGIRAAAHYGIRAVEPTRKLNETWEECFIRTCIDNAPQWIADRATKAMEHVRVKHAKHASTPVPDVQPCKRCGKGVRTWKDLAQAMYCGDPFSIRVELPYVEPEFFREGAGTWGGKPTF